jgi:hypothetical protein
VLGEAHECWGIENAALHPVFSFNRSAELFERSDNHRHHFHACARQ